MRLLLAALILGLGVQAGFAQGQQKLNTEFDAALKGLPPQSETSKLPADEQRQIEQSRALYIRGSEADQMGAQALVLLSLDLKANTVRSVKLLRALKAKLCAMGCVPNLTGCDGSCLPDESQTACKIRCLLQYDICLTQCLIQ